MLDEYRKEIDEIDNKILALLAKRNELARKIGVLKRGNNIPVVDKKREQKKLNNLIKKAQGYQISKEVVAAIWRTIFKLSYERQKGSA